ncbi:unnamed protein product [Caretta caretta]
MGHLPKSCASLSLRTVHLSRITTVPGNGRTSNSVTENCSKSSIHRTWCVPSQHQLSHSSRLTPSSVSQLCVTHKVSLSAACLPGQEKETAEPKDGAPPRPAVLALPFYGHAIKCTPMSRILSGSSWESVQERTTLFLILARPRPGTPTCTIPYSRSVLLRHFQTQIDLLHLATSAYTQAVCDSGREEQGSDLRKENEQSVVNSEQSHSRMAAVCQPKGSCYSVTDIKEEILASWRERRSSVLGLRKKEGGTLETAKPAREDHDEW